MIDGRSPPFVTRRSSASAAERYCVGSTPKPRNVRRHAASDGTSLSGVSPIRATPPRATSSRKRGPQRRRRGAVDDLSGDDAADDRREALDDRRVVAEDRPLGADLALAQDGAFTDRLGSLTFMSSIWPAVSLPSLDLSPEYSNATRKSLSVETQTSKTAPGGTVGFGGLRAVD